jgi:hypothetical protein
MTESVVDTSEACSVLRGYLGRYKERSYRELRDMLGRVDHVDLTGISGAVYPIDVHVIWSDHEGGDLWVMARIEDPERPAARPLTDSFVMRSDGTIVTG